MVCLFDAAIDGFLVITHHTHSDHSSRKTADHLSITYGNHKNVYAGVENSGTGESKIWAPPPNLHFKYVRTAELFLCRLLLTQKACFSRALVERFYAPLCPGAHVLACHRAAIGGLVALECMHLLCMILVLSISQ